MARRATVELGVRGGRSGLGAPAVRRAIRVPELALGVVLVVGGALGAAVWHRSVTSGETVVVAARDVPRGAVLTAADLAPAQVSGASGIALVEGSAAGELVGRIALVDIDAGTPWSSGLLTDVPPLAPDEGLAAVALAPGEAPPDLSAGDLVKVVVVPAADLSAPAMPQVGASTATVWQVVPAGDLALDTIVTLRLPLSEAAAVSAAAEVRLVRVEG